MQKMLIYPSLWCLIGVYDEFIDKYLYTKDEIGKASADLLSEALLKIK